MLAAEAFSVVAPPCPNEMSPQEIDQLVARLREVELKAWDESQAFEEVHIRSHLEVFPEGVLTAYSSTEDMANYRPCAWGLVELYDYKWELPLPSWYEVSDEGMIRGTHNPNGEWVYGVNLSVPRGVAPCLTSLILEAGKNIAVAKRKKGLLLGARIPRYYLHTDVEVNEYVALGLDPGIVVYKRRGLEVFGLSGGRPCVIPNYFEDPKSRDYGVLMVWHNKRR